MTAEIIGAVIGAVVAVVVCVINNVYQNDKTRALLEYRLIELEKKQDKHNQLIERMYELEGKEDLLEEKVKVANHRIDDLESHAV